LKKNLRKLLLKKRDGIKPEEKKAKEAAIRKRLYASADFKKANSILFYASFRSEVDTIPCILHALRLNKNVVLPRIEKIKRELRLFRINNASELESGYMGIKEPKINKTKEKKLGNIDLVIIPGAGFDVRGNRLGYGAGYYDRLLSKSKKRIMTIALAFEEQIGEEIPAEPHDIKVDMIITDKRLIRCKK
jgi:5-formyltetrahydrofolate cyclo-ligase